MKKKVIVAGSGGHSKVIIDILQQMHAVEILGITSVDLEKGSNFLGYPVLGTDAVIENYLHQDDFYVAIGIGGYRDNALREKVFNGIKKMGARFLSVIHPSAVLSKNVQLGEAVVIFPGVIINTDVKIGDNCIIATRSSIDHETVIGDNVLVSAGVTVGAYSKIGNNCLLALGSNVISGVTIEDNVLVASGAVVTSDIGKNKTVFGIPAKEK